MVDEKPDESESCKPNNKQTLKPRIQRIGLILFMLSPLVYAVSTLFRGRQEEESAWMNRVIFTLLLWMIALLLFILGTAWFIRSQAKKK